MEFDFSQKLVILKNPNLLIMTLSLDNDLEEELKKYPEVLEALPTLLREQIALERWRQKRYSRKSRDHAKRLIQEVQETNISREEAGRNLEGAIDNIARHFNPDHD